MIVLIRHGQTEWNKLKKFQGWHNSNLTDLGKTQALTVAKKLRHIVGGSKVTLVSSPLGRAMETAQIISYELGLEQDKIPTTPLLRECSFGEWTGMTPEEIERKYQEEWQRRSKDKWNYVISGGESYSMVAQRADRWLNSIVNDDDTITMVVSHEVIGKMIRGTYLKLDAEQSIRKSQNNNEIVVLENGKEHKISV
ncbi:histidine phosphatase family protein [Vibrio sp. WJH972]